MADRAANDNFLIASTKLQWSESFNEDNGITREVKDLAIP
jgi:hypothetical protein